MNPLVKNTSKRTKGQGQKQLRNEGSWRSESISRSEDHIEGRNHQGGSEAAHEGHFDVIQHADRALTKTEVKGMTMEEASYAHN